MNRRVTHGTEEVHVLNDMPESAFAASASINGLQDADMFFTEDKRVYCARRSSTLIYHGKDGKGMNLTDVKSVYCALEKEWYAPTEYVKLLKSVYYGRKSRAKTLF